MAAPTAPLVLDSSADLARFVYQGYSRFGNEGPITMAQAELSPRPGRITDIIDSPLPRDRPLDIRDTPEFLAVAHRVREGLREGMEVA